MAPSAAGPDDQQAVGPHTEAAGASQHAERAAGEASAAEQQLQGAEPRTPSVGGVDSYPMDYYARDGGVWASSYHKKSPLRPQGRRAPTQRSVAMPVHGLS